MRRVADIVPVFVLAFQPIGILHQIVVCIVKSSKIDGQATLVAVYFQLCGVQDRLEVVAAMILHTGEHDVRCTVVLLNIGGHKTDVTTHRRQTDAPVGMDGGRSLGELRTVVEVVWTELFDDTSARP